MALASCPALALGRRPRAALAATPLAENLLLITGAGANVLAARGPGGALWVDGGLEAHSAELERFAHKELGTRRVTTLFNTHWHPEQVGSNLRLGKRGATIVAHENTRLWLGRKINVSWREGGFEPLPDKALPTQTFFYGKERLQHGDELIEYGYMRQAHTDGDIYVHFRRANVIAAGGVVTSEGWPFIDWETGGWIGGMIAGIDRLLEAADEHTRIVPAQGRLLTVEELKAQRAMYMTIYERLVKALTSGLSPAEALAQEPARGLNEHWGDPNPFLENAFKSLWGHYAPDA
ncbi:MAG: hypothetical protein DIU71_01570 [Proteobacteria bacterium]|nr:MAG: hypothetical protein DIU71_01570 [Pseudomonadota bacterium]